MAKLLVIEDENRMAELLKRGLEESGHTVFAASDMISGMETFLSETVDMVISDIILPDGNGFDLCRNIRNRDPEIPILMLTALGTTDDKLEGFGSGADDYMVKPFDFRELEARIAALLRRRSEAAKRKSDEIKYADLKVNLKTMTVSRGNSPIILTPKEYNLLVLFVQNPDTVISRSEIAEKVWNMRFDTGTNFIDVYINYLRKKIDRNFSVKLIHTRPGMGFIFTDQPQP